MSSPSVLLVAKPGEVALASRMPDDLAPAAGVLIAAALGTIIWAALIAAFLSA